MCRRLPPLAVCLLLLLLVVPTASGQDLQTWTDSSGKYKTVAEFVRVDGQSVVLRKADGTEVTVALSKLNAASRQQAKNAAEANDVMSGLAPPPRATSPRRQAQSQSSPSMPRGELNVGSSAAASGGPPEVDAKTFLDNLYADYKRTQSLEPFWNAMPPSYKADAEGIVKLLGQKYDPALATEIDSLKKRLLSLLTSKKQFVLNSTALPMPPETKSKVAALYDPAVAMIDALLATDLLTPKNLQQMPMPELIELYSKRVIGPSEVVTKKMQELGLITATGLQAANIDELEYTVVQNDPMRATVTFIQDGREDVQELVVVEGHWAPEDMTLEWKGNVAQIREGLEKLTPQMQKQAAAQLKMVADQMLSGLEATKTQQEFDQMVGGLMMQAMMMSGGMGGGMGGPPGQPGGGFGGPGFGPPDGPGGPEFDKEDFSVPFE